MVSRLVVPCPRPGAVDVLLPTSLDGASGGLGNSSGVTRMRGTFSAGVTSKVGRPSAGVTSKVGRPSAGVTSKVGRPAAGSGGGSVTAGTGLGAAAGAG